MKTRSCNGFSLIELLIASVVIAAAGALLIGGIVSANRSADRRIEMVERTMWLPEGLHMSQAPAVLTSLPSGEVSVGSIIVTAPAYQREFRVTIDGPGKVRCDEDSTL